jgi:hypothetical protein
MVTGTGSVSAQDTWIPVSSSSTYIYEARAGSLEFLITERTKEPVVAMIVRSRQIKGNRVEFEKNYVKLSDCVAGYGKLVTTELSGRAKFDNDFITDGGNVASRIAETLCALAENDPRGRPSNLTPRHAY